MGFNLKAWASHALKVPKSLKKINVGKSIRRAVTGAIENFETSIQSRGSSAGQAVADVQDAARSVKVMPWIIGGAAVFLIIIMLRRR